MKAADRWVLWRLVWKAGRKGSGKWDKVPYQPNGKSAKSNDATTWGRFESVETAFAGGGFDGIGFMLGSGFAGIDLDGVRDPDTGELIPKAEALVKSFDTYPEISPSGTGVKLIGRGAWRGEWHRKPFHGGEIEVYDNARFFTITGERIGGHGVADIQAALNGLIEQFTDPGSAAAEATVTPHGDHPSNEDDAELLRRASTGSNGNKFTRLWQGDTSEYGGDESRADLALCGLLAFWAGGEAGRIDRLFRRSGLIRDKWDEWRGKTTYGARTITKALKNRKKFYAPPAVLEGALPAPGHDTERPVIVVNACEYMVNGQAATALGSEPDIFWRAGALVQVVEAPVELAPGAGIRRPGGAPFVRELSYPILRERLTHCAKFSRPTGDELKPAHPPGWCVRAVLARGTWPAVRPLEALVSHPVLLDDGSVLSANGYDLTSGLLLWMPAHIRVVVPDRPTAEESAAARDALLDVIADFPFETPAHRAAWVAGLLTPLAWFAFDGPAPLFLIDGNTRGVGKGLLADAIALILTGRRFPVMNYTNEREELRKRITSLAVEGERLVLLDNLAGPVGNEVLDMALTATDWSDRRLGGNQMYRGPLHISWFATGNNVQLKADTARRTCHIRMESTEERPELRDGFKYPDLRAHVLANRGRLLAAALTILRAWFAAGRPRQNLPAWGSFEGWSGVVREAVVFAGLPDPGDTRAALQTTADQDAVAMDTILTGLQQMDPNGRGVTVAQVIELVKNLPNRPEDWQAELRSAIEELCGRLDGPQLGYKFRHFARRNFGGRILDKGSPNHGSNRWVVRPVERILLGPDDVPHVRHVPPASACGGHEGHGGHVSAREKSVAETGGESVVGWAYDRGSPVDEGIVWPGPRGPGS